jgi:hypothetical protein
MHPPLGWLSGGRSGIGPRNGTRFPQLGPDVSDSSCSTAGSEVAGKHTYRGRRSEPRNYRSHHRSLGHYHFGDSDPAADLARPHREADPGSASTPARVQAGVRSQTSTGKPSLSASRCAPALSPIPAWLSMCGNPWSHSADIHSGFGSVRSPEFSHGRAEDGRQRGGGRNDGLPGPRWACCMQKGVRHRGIPPAGLAPGTLVGVRLISSDR